MLKRLYFLWVCEPLFTDFTLGCSESYNLIGMKLILKGSIITTINSLIIMKHWKFSPAVTIVAGYFIIGVLWILLTDSLFFFLFSDPDTLFRAQMLKVWLFVIANSVFFFLKIRQLLSTQQQAELLLVETEKRYRMLVEKLPAVVFMDRFDGEQTTQYISPRIKDLLGYSAEEWESTQEIWETSLHPDDRERVLAEDIRTNKTGEAFRIEYRLRHRDGHYVWVKEDASIITDENNVPVFWHGILVDITDQKTTEEAISRRDEILKAVGFSAEQFLKSSDWEKNIGLVLERLGQTTNVSRVYIFKKEQKEQGGTFVSQAFEWCDNGIIPQLQNHDLQEISAAEPSFVRWVKNFEQGLPIFGKTKDFPAEEQQLLQSQGILSLACIPIQAANAWWGFIGFDDCMGEREWNEAEIDALRAAASTLGVSIERQSYEDALLKNEASYRGLFNTVRDAIYIQDENGMFIDVNEGAVEMYGYPREYFIGKTPEFLSAPGKNDLKKVLQALQNAIAGEPQQFEFWGMRSNGDIFPKDVRLYKGVYLGEDVVIALAQDITVRKQEQDELRKQLRELSVLHMTAQTEATAKDVDSLIQQITDIISDTLYSDNCGVFLLSEEQNLLVPHYSYRDTEADTAITSIPITKGIAGKVVTFRRSIRVDDVSLEPAYFKISNKTRSELCVPINIGQKIFGVLNVESKKLSAFTEKDERLLNTIARGMANAMERIQLFENEQERRQQAEILREATLELTSFFESKTLFDNIFISLARLINYDSASIELVNQGYTRIVAGKNIPQKLIGTRYPFDQEKWGEINSLRHPIIISDVHTDDRYTKFEETSYIQSWMGIPLIAQDKIIGFLNLDSRTIGFFNDDHASLIQTFANQAAIAIENTRLFELEQRRRKETEVLSVATASLANTLDTESLLNNIIDWLAELAPYDSASIMLKQGGLIRLAASRNLPEEYYIGREFPLTEKWNQIAETRKPLILEDAQQDGIFEKWAGSEYIHGWMATAMFAQDNLIGFINLDSREIGAYNEEHANRIQTFANQAATAIEKSRLFGLERKRRETAEVVRQAATALANLLDPPSLHNAILEWLHKITPYDSASILEIEDDHIRITAAVGLPEPEKALNQVFSPENTLCQLINESGQALIIDDCKDDPRFEQWGSSTHVRGWMGVPLTSRGQVIGYLTVDSRSPNAFTQSDAISVQTFAQLAATSLENVRLYTETRQRLEELEMMSRISSVLRAARDTNEMLPILLNEIKANIETEAAAILLYDRELGLLTPRAHGGWLADMPKTSFKPGEGIIGRVYSSGETYISQEFMDDPLVHPENANTFGKGWGGSLCRSTHQARPSGSLWLESRSPAKSKHITRA